MNDDLRARTDDPFLGNYNANDLRIASEFLSNWLPFLSRDLCHHCKQNLTDRIRSLNTEVDGDLEPIKQEENFVVLTPDNIDSNEINENEDGYDTNSLGSWKESKDVVDMNDTADTSSPGSWKARTNGWSKLVSDASTSETLGSSVVAVASPKGHTSWADIAQEDEFEEEEENAGSARSIDGNNRSGDVIGVVNVRQKTSRDQREYFWFSKVKRKNDFVCLERVEGKIVNVLDGLELHTGVFSAAEQKRIIDFVYELQEKGKKGELKGNSALHSVHFLARVSPIINKSYMKDQVVLQEGQCGNKVGCKREPGKMFHATQSFN